MCSNILTTIFDCPYPYESCQLPCLAIVLIVRWHGKQFSLSLIQFEHKTDQQRNIMHHEPAFAQDEYAMF